MHALNLFDGSFQRRVAAGDGVDFDMRHHRTDIGFVAAGAEVHPLGEVHDDPRARQLERADVADLVRTAARRLADREHQVVCPRRIREHHRGREGPVSGQQAGRSVEPGFSRMSTISPAAPRAFAAVIA
jgi:hypothetical protein